MRLKTGFASVLILFFLCAIFSGNVSATPTTVCINDTTGYELNWLDSNNPDTVQTWTMNTYIGNDTAPRNYSTVIKFNMSADVIPRGKKIINATLWLYQTDGTHTTLSSFPNYTVYGVDNQTWVGNKITYNGAYKWWSNSANNVTLIYWNSTTSHNLGGVNWLFNNVTDWFAYEYSQNRQNISFWINHTVNSTGNNAFGYVVIRTFHATVPVGNRPVLNITYDDIATPPEVYDAGSDTINIWSAGGTSTCASLLANVPTKVSACTSAFAPTCISVFANINVTRGGANNRTNFTIDGCELRMNLTNYLQHGITSWGNLSITKSNITEQDHLQAIPYSQYTYEMMIKPNSNFTLKDSYISFNGFDDTVEGQRGIEIYTPVFDITNNTFSLGSGGFSLYSGANGSIIGSNLITNIPFFDTTGIGVYSASNITIENVTIFNLQQTAASSAYGIHFWNVYNSSIRNINVTDRFFYGIEIDYGANNTVYNITTVSSWVTGINLVNTENNTLSLLNSSLNDNSGVAFVSSSRNNVSFLTAAKNLEAGVQMTGDSSFNLIRNSILSGTPAGHYETEVWDFSLNNTFLNTTYPKENVDPAASLDRKWYLDVSVKDSLSAPISGVNVTFFNELNSTVNYSLTNVSGYVFPYTLLSYTNMGGNKFYNITFFWIAAWKKAYSQQTNSMNFTDPNFLNSKLVITMPSDVDTPVVSNFQKNSLCTEIGNDVIFTFSMSDIGSDIAYYSCNFTSPASTTDNSSTIFGTSYMKLYSTTNYAGNCSNVANLSGDWRLNVYATDKSDNQKIVSYLYYVRELYGCTLGGTPPSTTGGAGSGASSGATTIIIANASFVISPSAINKLVALGESKLIDSGNGHTFAVRNDAPSTIYLRIEPKGDYASFIKVGNVNLMQAVQAQEFDTVEVSSGKTANVDLYTSIPLGAKDGSYQVVVTVTDKNTGAFKDEIITLTVSPLTSISKEIGRFYTAASYPLILEKGQNFTVTSDGIKFGSIVDFSFPIGWLLLSGMFAIVYYTSKFMFKPEGKFSEYIKVADYSVAIVAVFLVVLLI